MTVRELAALAGMSGTALCCLELGQTLAPRVQTVQAVRDALQARGIYFLAGGWVRYRDDQSASAVSVRPGNVTRQS